MDYQDMNFADLQEQYCDRGRAASAIKMLRDARAGKKIPDLAYLLCQHDEKTVSDFDFLIAYYSLLEIACQIRYVASTFSEAFRKEALYNLSLPAIKRYYEENYPNPLPCLFRLRLEGISPLYEENNDQTTHPLFLRFLGIVNRMREDDEIERFQWFLNSGWTDGYGIFDPFRILKSPESTMRALMKNPAKRTIPEQLVSGAQKFIIFCGEFDDLLEETQQFSLFQSAMWSYYSYWFDLIGQKVGRCLGHILDSFIEWDAGDSEADLRRQRQQIEKQVTNFWRSFKQDASHVNAQKQLRELRKIIDKQGLKPDKSAIGEYVKVSKNVIERLLSGRYGQILRAVSREHAQQWDFA